MHNIVLFATHTIPRAVEFTAKKITLQRKPKHHALIDYSCA